MLETQIIFGTLLAALVLALAVDLQKLILPNALNLLLDTIGAGLTGALCLMMIASLFVDGAALKASICHDGPVCSLSPNQHLVYGLPIVRHFAAGHNLIVPHIGAS